MLYKNLLISLILVLGSLIPNFIEIKSSELDQILDIGREKLLESDFKGALKEFNNVIKDNPKIWQAFQYRAISKYRLKNYKGALKDFNRAIEINPNNLLLLNYRALTNVELGNIDDSINDINLYLSIDSSEKRVLDYLTLLKKTKIRNYYLSIDNAEEKNDYKEIINILQKIIKIREEINEVLAGPYADISYQYYRLGDFQKAINYLSKAISLEKSLNGKKSPNYSEYLDNLAFMYHENRLFLNKDKFNKALLLLEESLNIKKLIYGDSNINTASGYNKLANLYSQKGKYSESIKLRNKSIKIAEALDKVENFFTSLDDYKTLLYNSISSDYTNIGDINNANKYSIKRLKINNKLLNKNDIKLADNFEALGGIYFSMGDFYRSQNSFENALMIYKKNNKNNKIQEVENMISLISMMKNSDLKLKSKKLKIVYKEISKDDPAAVFQFIDNATIHLINGSYDNAIENFNNAKDLLLKTRGKENFQMIQIYTNLGKSHLLSGDLDKAEKSLLKALQIYNSISNAILSPQITLIYENLASLYLKKRDFKKAEELIDQLFANRVLYAKEQSQYLSNDVRRSFNKLTLMDYETIFSLIGDLPRGKELAFKARLNRHGLLEDIEKYQANIINLNDSDRLILNKLKLIDNQLSDFSIVGNERLKLNKEKIKIENTFYSKIPSLKPRIIEINDIKEVLPRKSTLVEFQKFKPLNFKNPNKNQFLEEKYVALILNRNGEVDFVELGLANNIDKLIQKALYSTKEYLDDADDLWKELGNLIFNPIINVIGDSDTLFISPDSELNRVPFAALGVNNSNKYLGETYKLRLLTTGRELLSLKNNNQYKTNQSIVLANPLFDLKNKNKNKTINKNEKNSYVVQKRSAEFNYEKFNSLPETEKEGKLISSLIDGKLFLDEKATVLAVQKIPSPKIVHIASHAKFISDNKDKRNPLLRGMIILAGANNPKSNILDDGILTALEITRLNWTGTDLVVVSACESGLGEISSGEGIYGLKRAISVAGAKSSLLSLWKVNDLATAEFMESFYLKLTKGEGKAEALANTQTEFRNGDIPEYRHPNVWAAFQLNGDWGQVDF